jgi:cephalosporin hydroxylase
MSKPIDTGSPSGPTPGEAFAREVAERLRANGEDAELRGRALGFTRASVTRRYSYNFSWMGRPIIQYPQDIVAMQELLFAVQPDLVIETGVAHGGSLVLSASMLALNALSGGPADARVVGVDIDIRAHNRAAIEAHPMAARITLLQGSSVDPDVIARVSEMARGRQRVLVCLDSNHTHEHVLAELDAYAPLVTPGSYCVVFDTVIEDVPECWSPDRPWRAGNNPASALAAWLPEHPEFVVDAEMDHKLMISAAPGGFLKRAS